MTRHLKKLLVPLGMLAFSVLLSLVAAEIVIRVVRPQPRLVITPGGFYQVDPPGRYRLSPGYRGRIYNRAEYDNAIRINQHGLRGEEVGEQADAVTRILTIGDSFVFGVGVEEMETFASLVAQSIGREAEGLNAGIPAFGVPDAVNWLARHGIGLTPDVVILAIFQGNDLTDASPDQEKILIVDGLLVPGKSATGLKAWLHRHSHLYVLLKSLLEQPGLMPLREKLGLGEPWKTRVLREEFGVYRKSAAQDLAAAIEATDQALQDLVLLAKEQSFFLMSVLIPSEIQVDPDRWAVGLASLGLDPDEYDPQVPTRIFEELLAKHSIPAIDLGPSFSKGLSSGEELYFLLDRHWTTRGHRLANEEIGAYLTAHFREKERDSPDETPKASAGEPEN